MPGCAIISCKNRSDNINFRNNGVSFHRFPTDPEVKQKWIYASCRGASWLPLRTSTICSEHFRGNEFRQKCRRRLLFDWAVPTRNLPYSHLVMEKDMWPSSSGKSSKSKTKQSVGKSSDSSASKKRRSDKQNTLEQCRCCGEFTQDIVNAVDAPYVSENKTTLAFNDVSIELDFDDALSKTVCRHCDEKLQELWDFVKVVNDAQNTLANLADSTDTASKKDIEESTVKKECDSPTPEEIEVNCDPSLIDNETQDDDKVGIVDSLTVNETSVSRKRKPCKGVPEKRKKAKKRKDSAATDVKIDEHTIDVKEEVAEPDEASIGVLYERQPNELDPINIEPDIKPSTVELSTSVLIYKIVNHKYHN